jgi:DNA-binding LacI/PurR family transcriptional regulator
MLEAMRRHLNRWEKACPTAFVCTQDYLASLLYQVLRERGLRIPEDVSVIGTGNTHWADALHPHLSTICLDETQIAKLAIMVNQEPPPLEHHLLRSAPKLVLRESVAKPA